MSVATPAAVRSEPMRSEPIHRRSLDFLLAPIRPLLADDGISEIMVNGHDDVRIERGGRIERTDYRFKSHDELFAAVRNMAQYVGRRVTAETNRFDARLPDGSRVHVVLPPASRQGICVAIRKFLPLGLSLDELVRLGSMTDEVREFISICVAAEKNILVSGGTGSGKTTLLNVLSSLIPGGQRVLVLEDSSELQLQQEHVLYFETRAADRHGRGGCTIRDLFHSSLRMRPDRIVVGECRGGEAMDLIQAMTSGHGGSMTTLHATAPGDALNRLETMALMSGVDMPLRALRAQVASAIDVVVQVGRLHDGARKIVAVSEAAGLDDEGRYRLVDIYHYVLTGRTAEGAPEGELTRTRTPPGFWAEVRLKGLAEMARLTRDLFESGAGGATSSGGG